MRLDEAKVILEENGYELIEEGKLGRALTAGALALGSLFNSVFANDEFDNRPKIEIEDGLGYKQIKMLGGGKYKIKTKSSLFGTSIEEGTFVDVDSDFPQLINGVEYNYDNDDKSIYFYKNKKLVKCLIYNKNSKKFEEDENKCHTWVDDLKLENKINEGKLGRTVAAGALSLGSLFGNVFGNEEKIDCPELDFSNIAKTEMYLEKNLELSDYDCYETEEGNYTFELKQDSIKKIDDDLKQYFVKVSPNGKMVALAYSDSKGAISIVNDSSETRVSSETYFNRKPNAVDDIWYNSEIDVTYIKNIDNNGNGTLKAVLGNAVQDIDDNNNIDKYDLVFEANYKNKKLNGKYYEYYPNGELKSEGTYVNDKVNGVVKEYFESGKLAMTYKMVNGKQVGLTQCSDGRRGNSKITCYDKE